VQGIHGQLLMRSLRRVQSVEYSLDASALPITVREAAFVEAADCFAALIAKPEVTCQAFYARHNAIVLMILHEGLL